MTKLEGRNQVLLTPSSMLHPLFYMAALFIYMGKVLEGIESGVRLNAALIKLKCHYLHS